VSHELIPSGSAYPKLVVTSGIPYSGSRSLAGYEYLRGSHHRAQPTQNPWSPLRDDTWDEALSPDLSLFGARTIRPSLPKPPSHHWDTLLGFTLSRWPRVSPEFIPSGSAYSKSLFTSEIPPTPHPNFHM
jgi:hypothetical protein